jgi:S-adenosylmethionine synthetase
MTGVFTSESVTEGHPDKIADQISDAILDACLKQDPLARVACETLVAPSTVVLAGEITTRAVVDREAIVRDTVARIGYDDPALGFAAAEVSVSDHIGTQSAEIAAGVDCSLEARDSEIAAGELLAGAGDQGMMFGYATDETPELMPLPIAIAHALVRTLAQVRRDDTIAGLRPDGKTQVTVRYNDRHTATIERVVISAQHSPELDLNDLRDAIAVHVVAPVISGNLLAGQSLDQLLLVNPAGRFTLGGPAADAGLTGRKIIVDSYGGMAPHGGGAFSGKDPSKVDRSGAYAARHVACNVVAAGLATRCLVQIAYAIGVAGPVAVSVETFGTGRISDDRLAVAVQKVFDLRPGAIRSRLGLHRPIYGATAAYGHFGRTDLDLPWECTDCVEQLREAARC